MYRCNSYFPHAFEAGFIYLFYDDQSGYDVSNIVIIFTALKQNKNNSVKCFEMFFFIKPKRG